MNRFPSPLAARIHGLVAHWREIPAARKVQRATLAQWIAQRLHCAQAAQVVIICAHNARHSHMEQLGLAVGALWYELQGLKVCSGGT